MLEVDVLVKGAKVGAIAEYTGGCPRVSFDSKVCEPTERSVAKKLFDPKFAVLY